MDNFDFKKFLIENRTIQKENYSGAILGQVKFALSHEPKDLVQNWMKKIASELKAGENKYRSYTYEDFMKDYESFSEADPMRNVRGENKMTQPSQIKEGLKYLAHHLSVAKNRLGSEPKDLVQSWLKSIKDELKSGETKYETYQAEDWLNHYEEFSKGDSMRNVRGMGRADKPFMKRNPNRDTLE